MKITLVFPGRAVETAKPTGLVMPLAPTLLAALTPAQHEVTLVDMFAGDKVDYEKATDVVGITVRTPLAPIAYSVADEFLKRGKQVILGGPHVHALPAEAKEHASAVAIGEGEKIWPIILADCERGSLKSFYVSGPYSREKLKGEVYHQPERPQLQGLPMMRRDLLPKDRYFMDSIFTTRGCPNHCRFCPVTSIFGGKIRHRPIDEVIAEVETLGPRFFSVDDSVFGHPQIRERADENQYYLDLYRELSKVRPRRKWTGAGGISAINYRDGRKILELAAESGLSSIAAGLESITCEGQKQSGAWRKFHSESPDTFQLDNLRQNIRDIQNLGIEIKGFFVVGWDNDTVDIFQRTLDFCDEMNIIPFIFLLMPIPGSKIYEEYLAEGRIDKSCTWDYYGGNYVVFDHPRMTRQQILEGTRDVMTRGYSMGRIMRRTLFTARKTRSLSGGAISFFTQMGLKKVYRQLFAQTR